MKKLITALSLSITGIALPVSAQTDFQSDSVFIRKIYDTALAEGKAYEWLRHLTQQVGPRLSGSEGAAKAVVYTKSAMEGAHFDNVFLQNVLVPHWVRGAKEKAQLINGKQKTEVPIAALGGSVATPKGGVKGKIIEVRSFQQLRDLGSDKVKGKIVFFNRPMDPTKINTFEAYAGAVEQRAAGASEAAKLGAIGSITRSMTTRLDDFPHTGSMRYASGAPMIPAAAISTNGAELLSKTIKENPDTEFYFEQYCETLPDAASHNVIGELKGQTNADKFIAVGGHLDSWDFAQGAHDDGSGCVQSIEAVRILKTLGYQPNNTLRAVMFMNEENGMRGGVTYADSAKSKRETHIAAIESDHGGFRLAGSGSWVRLHKRPKYSSGRGFLLLMAFMSWAQAAVGRILPAGAAGHSLVGAYARYAALF